MVNQTTNENTINKTITFHLTKCAMPIIEFINSGHSRSHIIMLFEKLQSLGFGEYIVGQRGRGFTSQFIPNKKCPEVYMLDMKQKKRGRKVEKNV